MYKSNLYLHFKEFTLKFYYYLISLFSTFLVCFIYNKELFFFISKPFVLLNKNFIFTNITEAFFIYFKLSLFASFFLTYPVLLYFVLTYICISFYHYKIKKIYLFILSFYSILVIYVYLIYHNILFYLIKFFLLYESNNENDVVIISLQAKLDQFFSFFLWILLIFLFLAHMPLLKLFIKNTTLWYTHYRKLIYSLILIIFILIAPPDIFLQIIILPIILLFTELIFYLSTILIKSLK